MSVFNIKIKKHNFSKSLILKIDPITKEPVLITPIKCSKKIINNFLKESREWLISKIIEKETPKSIKILEEDFTILKNNNDYLDLKNKNIYTSNYKIMHLFKDFAKNIFEEQCLFFKKKLNVNFQNLVINDSKRRLGSYRHSSSTITLSMRLLLASKKAMSYVCAHEITHIVHQNHQKEFHSLLESLVPNHREEEKWLKANSNILFAVE